MLYIVPQRRNVFLLNFVCYLDTVADLPDKFWTHPQLSFLYLCVVFFLGGEEGSGRIISWRTAIPVWDWRSPLGSPGFDTYLKFIAELQLDKSFIDFISKR